MLSVLFVIYIVSVVESGNRVLGGNHIKKLGQQLYLGIKEVDEKIIEYKLKVLRARLSI